MPFTLFHLELWESSLSHEAVFLNILFVSREFIPFLEIFHYFLGLRLKGIWPEVLKKNSEQYNILANFNY